MVLQHDTVQCTARQCSVVKIMQGNKEACGVGQSHLKCCKVMCGMVGSSWRGQGRDSVLDRAGKVCWYSVGMQACMHCM